MKFTVRLNNKVTSTSINTALCVLYTLIYNTKKQPALVFMQNTVLRLSQKFNLEHNKSRGSSAKGMSQFITTELVHCIVSAVVPDEYKKQYKAILKEFLKK